MTAQEKFRIGQRVVMTDEARHTFRFSSYYGTVTAYHRYDGHMVRIKQDSRTISHAQTWDIGWWVPVLEA